MSTFRYQHVPPLFIATCFVFGGALPLWNPASAVRGLGLPDRIALSQPAQACFTIYGSRVTVMGMAMWVYYWQGKLAAMDTLLALMSYGAAVDSYICWQEGVPGKAVFRAVAGVLVGGWGMLGLSSK